MRKKLNLLNLIYITLLFLLVSCSATITTPESYKVKFDTDRGSYVESQYIKGGQCATLPATPIKSDYDFEYWMLNGKEFDFSTPITSNITLVAKWKLSDNHVCSYISTIYKATCVQPGYTVYKCSICNDTYQDNYIDELGHNLTTHAAKEPTESSVGWNEYVTCSRCDFSTYVEIPKLGHNGCMHILKYCYDDTDHWFVCDLCNEIYNVENKNVPFVFKIRHILGIDKLRAYSSNVSKKNKQYKPKALSLCRSRLVGFNHVCGPGCTEGYYHNYFKNFCHVKSFL